MQKSEHLHPLICLMEFGIKRWINDLYVFDPVHVRHKPRSGVQFVVEEANDGSHLDVVPVVEIMVVIIRSSKVDIGIFDLDACSQRSHILANFLPSTGHHPIEFYLGECWSASDCQGEPSNWFEGCFRSTSYH
jgi:hypothetical protein